MIALNSLCSFNIVGVMALGVTIFIIIFLTLRVLLLILVASEDIARIFRRKYNAYKKKR